MGSPILTPAAPSNPVRVALDAMGGDRAPRAVVEGALLALERLPQVSLSLVGDETILRATLRELGGSEGDRLAVVHASEALGMAENPVAGLKSKPDNSISRALREVQEGRAAAMFSAGNTGGVVAAATMHLERIRGVKRPGIAVPFPTLQGACLVIDVGANINCRPSHLLHYAHMASAYACAVLGVEKPRVGMLNIGEEEEKGTSLVKETAALIRQSGLHFVGNVEGHGIFTGNVDVVVCEGFVGNMVLKTAEGLAECVLTLMAGRVREVAATKPEAAAALKDLVGGSKSRMDYATYGGAPLLGFEGAVMIGHGRSSPEAIANAVRGSSEFAAQDVNRRIRDAIRSSTENRSVPGSSTGGGGGETAAAGSGSASAGSREGAKE